MSNEIISYRKNYDELLELISLAEKTSENITKYKSIRSRNRVISISFTLIALLLCFLGVIMILNRIYELFSFNIGYITIVASFILIIPTFMSLSLNKKIENELRLEGKILEQLIVMIHNLKENVYTKQSISVVEKAMIEIRLSRIKFSNEEFDQYQNLKSQNSIMR